MISPFMFVIKSIPSPQNRNFQSIGGANVHIWVMDGEQDAALLRALAFIKNYLWEPQEVEYAFQPLPEQIVALGKDEMQLYRSALEHGIAADFLGWLKDEGESGDPVILWKP